MQDLKKHEVLRIYREVAGQDSWGQKKTQKLQHKILFIIPASHQEALH